LHHYQRHAGALHEKDGGGFDDWRSRRPGVGARSPLQALKRRALALVTGPTHGLVQVSTFPTTSIELAPTEEIGSLPWSSLEWTLVVKSLLISWSWVRTSPAGILQLV
jgi:hypothetical protein